MNTRTWPAITGVAINPSLDDVGDLAVIANLGTSPNYPRARVTLFETPKSAPVDEGGDPAPRVACALTSHQARQLAVQLLEAADVADAACPEHAGQDN